MRGQRPPVRIFARGKERNPLAGAKRRRMRGPAGGRAPSGGRHAGRRFRFAFSQEERNGTRLPARSGGRIAGPCAGRPLPAAAMRGQRPPVRIFAGGKERNPLAGAKRREDCGALRGEEPLPAAAMRGDASGSRFRRRNGTESACRREAAEDAGPCAGRPLPAAAMRGDASGSHFRRRKGTEPACRREAAEDAGPCAGRPLPAAAMRGGAPGSRFCRRNGTESACRREAAEDAGPCAGRPLPAAAMRGDASGSHFRRRKGTEPACRREAAGGLRGPAQGGPFRRPPCGDNAPRFAFSQEERNGTRLRRRCRQSSSKRGGRRSGVALHGKGRARSDRMETGRCLKPAIRPEIAGDRACGTEVGRISRAPFQQSVGWKSAPRRKTDAAQAGGEGAVRFNRRSPPARRRPTAGGAAAPGPRRN